MKPKSLRDLYLEELRDAWDAEKQITQALPKMIDATSNADLKAAFKEHLKVTESQQQRLEKLFSQMGEKPEGKKCTGMAGIISEGSELLKQGGEPDTLDAGLIASAQKVEHYEIATYGTLVVWARLLGETGAAQVLHQIAAEEGEADKKMTMLAEKHINREAMQKAA